MKQNAKQIQINNAADVLTAYKGNRVIVSIPSVSRSGMSRKIKFAVNHDGHFIDITRQIATVTGFRYNADHTMSVSGCGMDMVFHVLYTLNRIIALRDSKGEAIDSRAGYNYLFPAENYILF